MTPWRSQPTSHKAVIRFWAIRGPANQPGFERTGDLGGTGMGSGGGWGWVWIKRLLTL